VARDITYRMLMTEKDVSAGPFYMWTGAEVGSIRTEQWPYHVAKLVSQPSPLSAGSRLRSIQRCRQLTPFALAKISSSCSASPSERPRDRAHRCVSEAYDWQENRHSRPSLRPLGPALPGQNQHAPIQLA
jgi:hypothetical protein